MNLHAYPIIFNKKGESDYYTNFIETILPNWNTNEKGYEELKKRDPNEPKPYYIY